MDTKTASQNSQAENAAKKDPEEKVNLQELAEEIYRLLKKELMLENERRGRRGGSNELN